MQAFKNPLQLISLHDNSRRMQAFKNPLHCVLFWI